MIGSTVGVWLAQCWFMVGRILLYGWPLNVGPTFIQRANLRWPNQICCCWTNIKPTVWFWLANGYRASWGLEARPVHHVEPVG